MRNFAEEMRRGMGKGMIAAILMTMFPMLLSVIGLLPSAYTERVQASGAMVNALYKSGVTPVAFIASAFAYSTSYMTDRNAGALKYQIMRCGRMRFAVDRFFANAICGALGVFLAEAIFFLIMRTIFPAQDIPYRYLDEVNAMMRLSYVQPELYTLIMLLLEMPGYMVMASVALATSTLVNNTYVTLASPIVYFGLVTSIDQSVGSGSLHDIIYTMADLTMWMNGYDELWAYLLYCAVGLALTFAVFYMGVRRYKGE